MLNAFGQVFDRMVSRLEVDEAVNWLFGVACAAGVLMGLYSSPSDTQQLTVIGIALTLIVVVRRLRTTSTIALVMKSMFLAFCFQALGIGIGGFIHDQFTTLY